MTEVDEAIAKYKTELLGEAELARDDIQEIEDHLRSLTEDLRRSGMPGAEAVRVACERLGDPRAIAREHARVRSPFGARLSRGRTFSAALLLAPLVLQPLARLVLDPASRHAIATEGVLARDAVVILAGIAMCIALLARRTWARPVVLGWIGFSALAAIQGVVMDGFPLWPATAAVGITLFLMPWRRGELGRAGYALALQGFAASVAMFVAGMMCEDGAMAPAAIMACLTFVIAVSGTVLRARWAAIASAAGGVLLVVSLVETAPYFFRYRTYFVLIEWMPLAATMATGALAAAIAAVISWRSARSATGTLRHVMRS